MKYIKQQQQGNQNPHYRTCNVQNIMRVKLSRKKLIALVKWEGFSFEEATWEPIQNILFTPAFQKFVCKKKLLNYILDQSKYIPFSSRKIIKTNRFLGKRNRTGRINLEEENLNGVMKIKGCGDNSYMMSLNEAIAKYPSELATLLAKKVA